MMDMQPTPTDADAPVALESVLCTDELSRRPSRPPDYETENRALVMLAQALADSPHTILQTLADTILEVFKADSAGLSLLTTDDDGKRFHWPAIAGVWKPHIGGGTPRDFGPCGDVLDRNTPLMFRHFERRYVYFQPVTPPVEECLLVPFYVKGKAVGTIWAIAHDDRRKFDAEDMRQLVILGRFASAAYQSVASSNAVEQQGKALRESEERYRRLFESAKDGILLLDSHSGRILDANPYMSDLLGYSHDGFMGKELWEIGLFSDKSASAAAVRELQEKGYIRYENLPLESNRGQRVEVEVVANVYREDHESVAQCNVRDITERSRLEKQTQRQAVELSDLHRRKDEFLAMLSHELRNPLAPILNAVQLLRLQGNEESVQRQARTIIERQVGQLCHLVDDLLEVSRITTGRIHLHQERISVGGIVENAVETVRPLIAKRRHALKLSLSPQPIWLYADATRLEQVVVNLLTNATKYTEEGGHIWLSAEQEGDQCVLRVRDTGIGILPELLPRIFDLFTQAERSLDRSQGGLGIGLALVQRLVELHGGTVEAYSASGQGSEFVVRLPVAVIAAPEPPSQVTEASQSTTQRLRVLVVDDNVDAAQVLAMLVKSSKHDVRTAHDGPTALKAALDYRPDVVLLDLGLPGLDGLEVAKRMRQLPVLQGVVLVAMTGYGQEADRQRSQEAGFDHHLVKPADFGNVQKILATASEKAL